MLLKVDFSKEPFQMLYHQLYQRVLKFALERNESESMIKPYFLSLISGDNRVHLLIDLDDSGKITAHCLFNIQPLPDNKLQIFCDQIHIDSGHNTEFVKDVISYLESIPNVSQINALTTEKRSRGWVKKYGFKISRVLVSKDVQEEILSEEEG